MSLTKIPGLHAGVDLEVVGEAFAREFFKRYEAGGETAVEEWMADIRAKLESIPKEMCKLLGYPTDIVI